MKERGTERSDPGRRRGGKARRLKPVLQATVADCAPACLAMVLAAHRRPIPVDRLRDELGAGRDGVRAIDVRDLAEANGLTCRAKRVPAERVGTVPAPSIAHWEGNHFVVIERVRRRSVVVIDPAVGRRRLVAQRVFDEWLAEGRRTARITWFWGDDRLTSGAVGAVAP